jgi:hypothetical protein
LKKSIASDAKCRTDLVATLLQSLPTLTAVRKRLADQFGKVKRRTKRCNRTSDQADQADFEIKGSWRPPRDAASGENGLDIADDRRDLHRLA